MAKNDSAEQGTAMVPLNTRVPASLYDRLTTFVYGRKAKQEKVTIQDVVASAVAEYLDKKKRGT